MDVIKKKCPLEVTSPIVGIQAKMKMKKHNLSITLAENKLKLTMKIGITENS
jgi:hypothetical protein